MIEIFLYVVVLFYGEFSNYGKFFLVSFILHTPIFESSLCIFDVLEG